MSRLRFGQRGAITASYDAETAAVIAAMTTPPVDARKALIFQLVRTMKAAGAWQRLDALWLLAAATRQASLVNWKNPGTYNLTELEQPTWAADAGYTGNGSNMQLSTAFDPIIGTPLYVRDDALAFCWSTKTGTDAGASLGEAGGNTYIYPRYTDGKYYYRINASASESATVADGSGLVAMIRTGASAGRVDVNGAQLLTFTAASAAIASNTYKLLVKPNDFYSGGLVAAGVGASLSAAQSLAMYNALRAYLQALGAVA